MSGAGATQAPRAVAPPTAGHRLVRVGNIGPAVVAAREPASPRAQALRGIAMRLMAGSAGPHTRCLAIVSAGRGDGRSFVAANLAVAFAQSGRRTALIDADLRAPCQHELFDSEAGPGLVPPPGENPEGYIGRMVPEVPGLYLISAGELRAPGAGAGLGVDALAALLEALRGGLDQIVIDTPAGADNADAEAVAAHAGAALLLVRRDATRLAAARRLADGVRATGAHIAGAVLAHR